MTAIWTKYMLKLISPISVIRRFTNNPTGKTAKFNAPQGEYPCKCNVIRKKIHVKAQQNHELKQCYEPEYAVENNNSSF